MAHPPKGRPKERPNHLSHHHGSPRPHHSTATSDNQRSHMDILACHHTRIATSLSRPHQHMDTLVNRRSHTDILAFRLNHIATTLGRRHHHRSPCGKNRKLI